MKKHFAILVGALTLGTAVSATLNDEAQPTRSVMGSELAATSVGSKQSEQILALWKNHASSSASVPLARPL